MKDPRPLIDHIYLMFIDEFLDVMRTDGDRYPSIDKEFFKWLFNESTIPLPNHPLHNHYINYHHGNRCNPCLHTQPSRLYYFTWLRENFICNVKPDAEILDCALWMYCPNEAVTNSILTKCHMISTHQAVTDMYMKNVRCHDMTTAQVPMLRNVKSLCLDTCDLPVNCLRNILSQLLTAVPGLPLKFQVLYFNPK